MPVSKRAVKIKAAKTAESYQHPEADLLLVVKPLPK